MYQRSLNLDVTRGFAIIFMAMFHFAYYLSRLFNWSFHYDDPKVYLSRLVVMTLFLSCAGIGLALQAKRGYKWPSFLRRTGILGVCALFISLISFWFVPNNWIYFGILQFLFTATLVGIIFSFIPRISLALGLTIILGHFFVTGQIASELSTKLAQHFEIINLQAYFSFQFLFNFLQPILHLPKYTFDITYFIPWFGLVLIGIYLGSLNLSIPSVPQNRFFKYLSWMGQHSLALYFAHAVLLAPIALITELIFRGADSTAISILNNLF